MTQPVIIGNATHIYALMDECGSVRYVGKTTRTLDARFKQHRTASRSGNLPVNRWFRKHEVTIELLETVSAGDNWAERERYWIKLLPNLLNLTDGGEGLSGHVFTVEHRQKIADALRTGSTFNCETCGSEFWRKRRDINKGDCRFCSRACYALSLKGVSRPVSRECTALGVAASALEKRSRTHCKRGHPLSGHNLFLTSQGGRGCKECRKIHKRTYREKAHG